MHLENTLVMYGIYNAETSESLVKTVHVLYSRQILYENLLQVKHQQHMDIIHKYTVNEAYWAMPQLLIAQLTI